jgi:hypothetical protein
MNTEERINKIFSDLTELNDYQRDILKLQLEALVLQAQLEQLQKEK